MRNYRGLDFNAGYPETELTLDNIKQILPVEFLKQLTQGVWFNGNLGDFGLARDAQEIVHWLADHSVPVYINSNASMRTPEWWARLARPGVRVGFAIDGLADTHSLYRVGTDFDIVIRNAKSFIRSGGNAEWVFIKFKHNEHQVESAEALSKSMGFERFQFKKSARFFSNASGVTKEMHQAANRKGMATTLLQAPTNSKYRNAALEELSKIAKSEAPIKFLPSKHYARKNLGYLIAIKNGAEIIIETDDDNIPEKNFWKKN
jgi:hypothetical protein